MINNLSGQGVQDYAVNQQASQKTTPVANNDAAAVKKVAEPVATPSTIVTLGTAPDEPITYATAGGIGKPPP